MEPRWGMYYACLSLYLQVWGNRKTVVFLLVSPRTFEQVTWAEKDAFLSSMFLTFLKSTTTKSSETICFCLLVCFIYGKEGTKEWHKQFEIMAWDWM